MDQSESGSDLEQIRRLKARYFRLMDTKHWQEWGDVFTPDARLRLGPSDDEVLDGRDAILDAVPRILGDRVTVHHGHMPEIEITGSNTATGIWAMTDVVDLPTLQLRGAGHYFDVYRRDEDGWRIASTELVRLRRDVSEPFDQATARSSIADLVARYNISADAGRFDETVSLFTPDAVMELPTGTHRGLDAIRRLFTTTADSLRADAPGTVRHLSSTLRIDVTDADRASGRAYYLVLLDNGPDHWGRYIDEYRRIDGRWYIAERRVTVDGQVADSWSSRAP